MRFLRDNGLTLALAAMFAATLIGMALTGHAAMNEDRSWHGQPTQDLVAYLSSGSFVSALFENWESEFLQMSAYVVLTAMLFQRGSAESRDPDAPARQGETRRARIGTRSRLSRWLYAHSLGLALFALFVLSFLGHWLGSTSALDVEASAHGRAQQGALAYLADPKLWFESFQNWQSEFLSTAVLVVLSIVLRQKGSPESKPLDAANDETGG